MLLDKNCINYRRISPWKQTNQDTSVNICIAPQWFKCRYVCWVVTAHWVTTVKYNTHQLIHSESINTPQLILGEGEPLQSRLWFCWDWKHCHPSEATSAAPSSCVPSTVCEEELCLFCGARSKHYLHFLPFFWGGWCLLWFVCLWIFTP